MAVVIVFLKSIFLANDLIKPTEINSASKKIAIDSKLNGL
jgi:hypothetical protein